MFLCQMKSWPVGAAVPSVPHSSHLKFSLQGLFLSLAAACLIIENHHFADDTSNWPTPQPSHSSYHLLPALQFPCHHLQGHADSLSLINSEYG